MENNASTPDIRAKVEALKLRNTYGPKMSARQQYANLMSAFDEMLADDPHEVDEFLKEEGYDLDKLDRQGRELFEKLRNKFPVNLTPPTP